jgi:hypothetical protein
MQKVFTTCCHTLASILNLILFQLLMGKLTRITLSRGWPGWPGWLAGQLASHGWRKNPPMIPTNP